MLAKAKKIVRENNNYSISFLQRTLKIGYNRAAQLIKIIKQEDKNYWMMLCKPNKWFGDKSIQNAQVNDILYNLTEYPWTTGRNIFDDIQDGDLGIIKVGNDNRSKLCRTIGDELKAKLDAGIYAIVEFKEKNGKILHEDNSGIKRVHLRVVRNLYKEGNIIAKDDTKKLLGSNFMSFSSKKISSSTFKNIEQFLS